MLISKCDTRFWPVAWCIDVKAQVVASKSPPKEQRCQLTNSLSQNGFKRARYAMSRAWKEFGTSAANMSCRQVTAPLRSPVRPSSASGPARSPATTVAWFFENRKVKPFIFEKKWKMFFVDLWMWVFTPGCKHFFIHLNFEANFYCLVQVILESLTEVRSTEASLKSYPPKTQEQKFTHAGISSSTYWCSTFMSNPICKFKRCDAWECFGQMARLVVKRKAMVPAVPNHQLHQLLIFGISCALRSRVRLQEHRVQPWKPCKRQGSPEWL